MVGLYAQLFCFFIVKYSKFIIKSLRKVYDKLKATIKLYKSDGQSKLGYPLKLILSHKKKERKKTINHSELDDWNIKTELPLISHPDFDALYPEILTIRKRALKSAFTKLTDFDQGFDNVQNIERVNVIDFYEFAQNQVDYMKEMKRFGNADAYEYAIN